MNHKQNLKQEYQKTVQQHQLLPPISSGKCNVTVELGKNFKSILLGTFMKNVSSIKKIEGKGHYEQEPTEIVICSDDEPDSNLLEEVNLAKSSFNILEDEEDSFSINDNDESDEDFNPNNSIRKSKRKILPKTNTVTKKDGIFIDAPINFTCAKCKETFSTFLTLSEHMKGRTCFKEVIKCKECKKEFGTKKNLYSHTQIHKKKEKGKTLIILFTYF